MARKGRIPPCSSCRLLRKKCGPNCPLAPYFPTSRAPDFDNLRRLYGDSNLSQAILAVRPEDRVAAVESMITQARMRSLDAAGVVADLLNELGLTTQELNHVLAQVEAHKQIDASGSGPEMELRRVYGGYGTTGSGSSKYVENIEFARLGTGSGRASQEMEAQRAIQLEMDARCGFGGSNRVASSTELAQLRTESGRTSQVMR